MNLLLIAFLLIGFPAIGTLIAVYLMNKSYSETLKELKEKDFDWKKKNSLIYN